MKTNLLLLLSLLVVFGCTTDDADQYQNIPITFKVPSNFPSTNYNFDNNPITEKGFELGKKLFYDGRLSSDGIISCGFCHIQEDAFTHHGHTFSHGVGDAIGTRNAPPIQNMVFQTAFMWDGATSHLDLQPIIPFTSEIEMHGNFDSAIEMMKNDANYVRLYKQAFLDGQINSENMLKALAQFQIMLVSANSKFDQYRRNENGTVLSNDETEGYTLFKQKCAACHATDLFTDNSYRNNGLPVNPSINDVGRFRVTELENDRFKFKVPSLRNIEKTSPYMHDGRFLTLEAVMNHYSSGIVNTQNLDSSLNNNGVLGIPLTASEKLKIITFLKTLTDHEFLTNPKFAEY